MKRVFATLLCAALPSAIWAQAEGTVPPDYPAQVEAYNAKPIDAQIEAVRRNYEDVRAKAQARIDARKRVEAEAAEEKAKQERRAQAAAAAARKAREKEAVRKAMKDEKYNEEMRELDLEMKRLDVRSKRSTIEVQEAEDRAKIRRANEIFEKTDDL